MLKKKMSKWLVSPEKASRRTKSNGRFRVEALESRQLLASVVIGGREVTSNADGDGAGPSTQLVDQVLATQSTVVVNADVGQLTRVSFLDRDGDIVFAEFGGSNPQTSMTITFDNPSFGVTAAKYNQPGVQYVQGNATITLSNTDAGTFVAVYALGNDPFRVDPALVNAAAVPTNSQGVFGTNEFGVTTAINGVANIKAINIIPNANSTGTNFGGISAADAVFSGQNGVVGISARNVDVSRFVQIGDIKASGGGVPTLLFGDQSEFGTVNVTGGDLSQPNGAGIVVREDSNFNNAPFQGIVSQSGESAFGPQPRTTSNGTRTPGFTIDARAISNTTQFVNAGNGGAPVALNTITLVGGDQRINLDNFQGSGVAATQDQINLFFTGRTFTGNVFVDGTLTQDKFIQAENFQGSLQFNGNVQGAVNVRQSISGSLIVVGDVTNTSSISVGPDPTGGTGQFSAAGQLHRIGNVIVTGNVSNASTISAEQIGQVQVGGNLDGVITTDVINNNGAFDTNPNNNQTAATATEFEGSIGNVGIGGNLTGQIVGILGVGRVQVTGDVLDPTGIVATGTGGAKIFTSSAPSNTGPNIRANVGGLAVNGDVDLLGGEALILINNNGTFGNVQISGNGTREVGTGTPEVIGPIIVGNNFGLGSQTTGTITIAEANAGTDVSFRGVTANTAVVGQNLGTIGNITITGNNASTFSLDGVIGSQQFNGVNVANVTVNGFRVINFSGNGDIEATNIGNVTLTAADVATPTGGAATGININPSFGGVGSPAGGIASFATDGTGPSRIGNITFDAGINNGTLNINSNVFTNSGNGTTGGSSIGNIALTGRTINENATFTSATAGTITVNSSRAAGFGYNQTGSFQFSRSVGAISVTGRSNISGFMLNGTDQGNLGDSVGGTGGLSATASTVTFTGPTTFTNGNVFLAKSTGALTFNGDTTFASGNAQVASFQTGSTGVITFGQDPASAAQFSTTTFTGQGFRGDDGTSALDNIAGITVNNSRIVGTAGLTAIQASSVGAVTVNETVTAQNQTFMTNFNVVAQNNGNGTAANGETIAATGANLGSFSIGSISVNSAFNNNPFVGSAFFAGSNSFIAQGNVGTLTVNSPVVGNQQTALFTVGGGLTVAAGVRGTTAANANALANGGLVRGIDFNGDGQIGGLAVPPAGNTALNAAEVNDTFSAQATVNVGNVFINAQNTAASANGASPGSTPGNPSTNYTGVDRIGGNGATANTGLNVFSGIVTNGTQPVNGNAVTAQRISTTLTGNIGGVFVESFPNILLRDPATGGFAGAETNNGLGGGTIAAPFVNNVNPFRAAIVAADSVASIQDINNAGGALTAANAGGGRTTKAVILGDPDTNTDSTVETLDQLLVIVV